ATIKANEAIALHRPQCPRQIGFRLAGDTRQFVEGTRRLLGDYAQQLAIAGTLKQRKQERTFVLICIERGPPAYTLGAKKRLHPPRLGLTDSITAAFRSSGQGKVRKARTCCCCGRRRAAANRSFEPHHEPGAPSLRSPASGGA